MTSTSRVRRQTILATSAIIAVAAASMGCSDSRDSGHPRSAADVADVPEWKFQRELLPSPPEHPISYVWHVAVSPSNEFYFTDSDVRDLGIWIIDSSGRHVRRIARRGRGPRELTSIGTMGFRADSFYVVDVNSNRLTFFNAAGQVLRQLSPILLANRRPATTGELQTLTSMIQALLPDGSVLVRDSYEIRDANSVRTGKFDLIRVPREMLGSEKPPVPLSTLATVTAHKDQLTMPGPGGFIQFTNQPWADGDIFRFASSGSVHLVVQRVVTPESQQPTFTLKLLGSEGELLSRAISFEREPVTDEMVTAAWHENLEATKSNGDFKLWPSEAAFRHAYMDSLYRPAYMPAVRDAFLGNDTTIWVQRYTATRDTISRWEVSDSKGQRVAVAILPEGIQVLAVSRSDVWALQPSDDGSRMLVRYRRIGATTH